MDEDHSPYLFNWEVAELFRQKTGLKLKGTTRTSSILIDEGPGYRNELFGPYVDPDNPEDVRLFLEYRRLRGTRTIDLLVQDCDDDVFLNSHAEGTEKYHDLRAFWSDEKVR